VVLTVGLFGIGSNARDAWTVTKERAGAASVLGARQAYAEFECMEADLRRRLPRSARLFVAVPDDPLWQQRLAELASPWFRLVPDSGAASHVIGVTRTVGAGCGSVGLVVEQP
jgi:hypothetical protein